MFPTKPNWFIAFTVPESSWLPEVLAAAPEGFRHIRPADLHVTVAFLGRCDSDKALEVWNDCAEYFTRPLSGILRGILPMGFCAAPSAYAIEVAGSELRNWVLDQRDAIGEIAASEPHPHRLLPHITIARPQKGTEEASIPSGQRWCNSTPSLDLPVTFSRLALMTPAAFGAENYYDIVESKTL